MILFRTMRRSPVVTLACIATLLAVFACISVAQEQDSAKRSEESSTAERQESATVGQQLAEASREAAGEEKDETAEFTQSPAVQWIAHTLHISTRSAYWVAAVLNFAVIALLIGWAWRTYAPSLFRNRTTAIQKAIEEARRTSAEAHRRLSEIEVRLSRLDSEIASMQDQAQRDAIAEEQKIRAAAEQEKRKIIESSELEIAAAAKLARRELKTYAAGLAVNLARNQIRVDHDTDEALLRSFADGIGNGSSKAPSTPGKDGR